MKRLGFWLGLLAVALVIGCGPAGSSSAPKAPPPSAAAAKAALEQVAKTGMSGSQMMALNEYVKSLRQSDPAKGEALAKEVEEMRKLGSSPEQMKAKAKEIADKL